MSTIDDIRSLIRDGSVLIAMGVTTTGLAVAAFVTKSLMAGMDFVTALPLILIASISILTLPYRLWRYSTWGVASRYRRFKRLTDLGVMTKEECETLRRALIRQMGAADDLDSEPPQKVPPQEEP